VAHVQQEGRPVRQLVAGLELPEGVVEAFRGVGLLAQPEVLARLAHLDRLARLGLQRRRRHRREQEHEQPPRSHGVRAQLVPPAAHRSDRCPHTFTLHRQRIPPDSDKNVPDVLGAKRKALYPRVARRW
jgi:hypothetical protein